ncbi:MAG: DUF7948 domain-containing protein, partial [Planctomycetota bacterium]
RDRDGTLEYDVLLEPGADLGQVTIRCEGVESLDIAADGSLVMQTAVGPVTQKPPMTWYELPSGRRSVECTYRLIGECAYGFAVAQPAPDARLVIDPGLEWASMLGGAGDDWILAMEADDAGNVTVAGLTSSSDFPTASGDYNETYNGGDEDCFVSRLSADGSTLLWSTFLGGSGLDWAFDMVMDGSGVVTVVGQTYSFDFPTTSGAYDETYNGGGDAFVARLDPRLGGTDQLTWSTVIGTTGHERGAAVDFGPSGLVTIAGYTESTLFPVTPGAYDGTLGGTRDMFVACLDPVELGSDQLAWSTYLGGTSDEGYPIPTPGGPPDADLIDIHVDGTAGDVFLTGYTGSSDYPTTPGAFQTAFGGSTQDAFATQLSGDGSSLLWSTFIGGNGEDGGTVIAVDKLGLVFVAGLTYSNNFPISPGAPDPVCGSTSINDGFVVCLDPELVGLGQLLYSTCLGGTDFDVLFDLVVHDSGTVTVAGGSNGGALTTPGAFQTAHGGFTDGYVAHLRPDGNGVDDVLYATFFGSTGGEVGYAARFANTDDVIIAGVATADDLTTPGAYQEQFGGGTPGLPIDGQIVRLDLCPVDIDDDGIIGITDFLALLAAWGPNSGHPADIDGDGTVGILDFLQLMADWGPCF